MPALRVEAALFALSATILTLEVLQTRIFAFSLDAVTLYLAVGVCLLGLGTASTVLALLPPLPPVTVQRLGAVFAASGSGAVVASHVVFAHWSPSLMLGGSAALPLLVALTVPYFCFGMVTTLLLMARGDAIGRAYAINLAGSGLGCLIVFPLLDHLGAERALVVVVAMAVGGALVLAPLTRSGCLIAGMAATLALVVTLRTAPALLHFRPDPRGQLSVVQVRATEVSGPQAAGARATSLFTRWDQTARVDVYKLEGSAPALQSRIDGPIDLLFFVQDASAGSILLGVGDDLGRGRDFFERTVYGAGYARGAVRDVLVVGLGGAPDVLAALYHGATRIDAVEINRATINMVRNEFSGFLGNPYRRPEVTVHQLDGRTFLRLTDRTYDLIQMSGVDTKSLLASGSLAVNENYLYTREAMRDLLRHLNPDGVLAIIRFNIDIPRLASTAVAALRDLGQTAPEQHLFAVSQGIHWHALLIKRSPLTPSDTDALHRWVERAGPNAPDIVIPPYDLLGISLRHPLNVVYMPTPDRMVPLSFFQPYFQALAAGRLEAFEADLARKGVDVSPPSDDRPFFWFTTPAAAALRSPPPALRELYRFLQWLATIAAALILLPLVAWRWRGLGAPRVGRALAYFTCLGAGFMFVEIGLIHHFVLLLGHQSYAISTVLFGLLLGAGAGSVFSSRVAIAGRRPLTVALAGLILVILVYAFALASVFDAAAASSFATRLTLALGLLAGLGFCLGIPFPTALRAVYVTSPALVAWAVGINGFASVVGATLAMPLAMLMGLRALLLLGALLYALALVTSPIGAAAHPVIARD